MENKILVTGATGNIGKEVVKLLSEKDANFAAVANDKIIDNVETVSVNYAEITSLKKAMEEISTLFMVLPNHPEMVKWGQNIILTCLCLCGNQRRYRF
ncbi:NAD-dependent epimerase/dehydratase family protein [bacterium]|nr:NAD-dependent epimerase/dehydratase family protein [bacterium]